MSQPRRGGSKTVNLGRHKRNCSVCCHDRCTEIEADFISWRSPAAIAKEYGLADRTRVYRHAHAFNLFAKRQRNVRVALERIIEQAGEVDVTAPAVVAAVQAYSKINAAGQWVERSEHVNLNELFERMSQEELEAYARDGALPRWFTDSVAATAGEAGNLMYQMLQTGEWQVADTCPKLIEAIPSRMHDEKRPGDVLKVPGDPLDDVADDVRYGLYTFINASEKPHELRLREAQKPLAEIHDMTSAYVRWKQATDEPQYRPAVLGRYGRRRY